MAKKPHELEEYDPDFSPMRGNYAPPPAPAPREKVGFYGCIRDSLAILVLGIVVLLVLGGAYWYLTIREAGDTTENVVDSVLDSLFGSGENVTKVDVRQMILAVRQEAWLETVRETQSVDVQASISMPSPLPGRRSMRYLAFVTVTAGVNLELVTEDDFKIEGDTLTITLPNAQLKDCILDQAASRYYDVSCNYVGCGDLESILYDSALETAATQNTERLYSEAWENTQEYVTELGKNLGFETVVVLRDPDPLPPVADGGTCNVALPPTPTPAVEVTTTP